MRWYVGHTMFQGWFSPAPKWKVVRTGTFKDDGMKILGLAQLKFNTSLGWVPVTVALNQMALFVMGGNVGDFMTAHWDVTRQHNTVLWESGFPFDSDFCEDTTPPGEFDEKFAQKTYDEITAKIATLGNIRWCRVKVNTGPTAEVKSVSTPDQGFVSGLVGRMLN